MPPPKKRSLPLKNQGGPIEKNGRATSFAALVFPEKHVQHPIQLVFDTPMQAHGGQHLRFRCKRTADEVMGFLGHRTPNMPFTVDCDNAAQAFPFGMAFLEPTDVRA